MNPWWKMSLTAALILFVASLTWHLHTVFDQAELARSIAAQAAADKAAQQQAADRLAAAEQELAQERRKSASLEHQWSTERAKNHPADCDLPAAALSLLRQARAPRDSAR